jgi:hypothetical protein
MKTNTNSDSELRNRTAQQGRGQLPRIDFAKRNANRQLPTDEVLSLLEKEAPLLLLMAQIVGKCQRSKMSNVSNRTFAQLAPRFVRLAPPLLSSPQGSHGTQRGLRGWVQRSNEQ